MAVGYDYIRFQADNNFRVGVKKVHLGQVTGNSRHIRRVPVNGDQFVGHSQIYDYFGI
jgi:hypothetical protein